MAPPTFGAMISNTAPSFFSAFCSADRIATSKPSVTRMPSLRPSKRFGPFSMMLSAGDGSRSWRVGTAASAGLGIVARPSFSADLGGQRLVDVEQMRDHPLADDRRLHLAQLEGQRRGDVVLLRRGLADEELPGLAVVVGKALGAEANLRAFLDIGERAETALGDSLGPSPNEFGW